MASILIIDDEENVRKLLSACVREEGHEPVCAPTLKEGLDQAREGLFDVVLLDVTLPDGNGLEALPAIKAVSSLPEVIIITGHAHSKGAELAIHSGAWDYLRKGTSLNELSLTLTRALAYREKGRSAQSGVAFKREAIIGDSPRLRMCLNLAAQAACHDANVLLSGETGTGKELFALAIHENSPRANGSFVVVDCSALPEPLVEGLLFGHEKGSFTGAERSHPGLVEQADGGTLVLDEVGELPLEVQKAFLRVLQERRFRPVGSDRETTSDFRLIASTNRDLDQMVEQGRFRNDLLFRLRTLSIELPPLRARKRDISAIAEHQASQVCGRYGVEPLECSPEFLHSLMEYDWPGNVRELVHSVEQAVSSASGEQTLYRNHLPASIRAHIAGKAVRSPSTTAEEGLGSVGAPLGSLRNARDAAEKAYLERLLATAGGNVKEACRVAGVSRSRLYALLGKHGLSLK